MSRNRPDLVPASLQRVRCFLNTKGRMKVKPWAGPEETLDAFHDALVSHRDDDAFWTGMKSLLEALASDMSRRLSGDVVDNEVLDPETHQALLEEIRAALAQQKKGRGGFCRLASSLSVPAVGLLAILGGVATVGCGSTSSIEGDTSTDVATETVDPAVDPIPEPLPEPGCEHEGMTLERILGECVENEEARTRYIECIDGLHSSWHTGLRDLFECEDCWEVLSQLDCLAYGMTDFCSNPEEAGEYDLDTLLDNCSVLLYLGVRFD
ncbi:MAG: hypothetical protein JRG91_09940 [Deltaproteobacteria bacterium]|nr:hypothetical protein [Deltaproteobacteria bacterium]